MKKYFNDYMNTLGRLIVLRLEKKTTYDDEKHIRYQLRMLEKKLGIYVPPLNKNKRYNKYHKTNRAKGNK